jgi:hypothetical protein
MKLVDQMQKALMRNHNWHAWKPCHRTKAPGDHAHQRGESAQSEKFPARVSSRQSHHEINNKDVE